MLKILLILKYTISMSFIENEDDQPNVIVDVENQKVIRN